jgi:hypothetical protein
MCARALQGGTAVHPVLCQVHEGRGVRKNVRRIGGSKASKGNPKSGTGMKQARQIAGGAKRREGEKP